eukprot:4436426-Pleurochrysis_carterae.AAC.1
MLPPDSLRINKSCAVTREDPYLRNVPMTSGKEHNPTEGKNAEIQRARNHLLRAGDEEETQLRSPATAAFANSLIKYLEALRKASQQTRLPEKTRKLRRE